MVLSTRGSALLSLFLLPQYAEESNHPIIERFFLSFSTVEAIICSQSQIILSHFLFYFTNLLKTVAQILSFS
jgi:hypothetical protein